MSGVERLEVLVKRRSPHAMTLSHEQASVILPYRKVQAIPFYTNPVHCMYSSMYRQCAYYSSRFSKNGKGKRFQGFQYTCFFGQESPDEILGRGLASLLPSHRDVVGLAGRYYAFKQTFAHAHCFQYCRENAVRN